MADELADFCREVEGNFVPQQDDRINRAFEVLVRAVQANAARADKMEKTCRELQEKIARLEQQPQQQTTNERAPSLTPPPAEGLEALAARVEEHQTAIDQVMGGRILVVDPHGAAPFLTIPAALDVARSDDILIVRPGVYSSPLVLDKDVVVRGVDKKSVLLRHDKEACAVVFRAGATLQNMTVESVVPHNAAVRFEGGDGILTGCTVTSVNLSCVVVVKGSPTITDCDITGSKQHGVSCKPNTAPLISRCRIFGNKQPNIVVEAGANPTIAHCDIHSSEQNGVWFRTGSRGSLVSCSVYNNKYSNIDISAHSEPVVHSNKIYGSEKCGICVADQAGGDICDNDVHDNTYSNVGIMAEATPVVAKNRIYGSKQHGILVKAGAAGSIHDNTLWDNALANIKLEQGATTLVQSNTR